MLLRQNGATMQNQVAVPMRMNAILSAALAMSAMAGCVADHSAGAPAASADACERPAHLRDDQLAAQLDAVIERAATDGFAGTVAVLRGGELIYSAAAGSASLDRDIPVREDTLFHVASIAKYFAAVLTMKAVDEGLVSLRDPISKLAPDMALARRGVTFEDLLSHRSGLGSSYVAEQETDAAAALAAIDNTPVDLESAGAFKYSNDGYDLLTILLERAYKRPFEEVFREKILKPACLDNPRFWSEADLTDPAVVSQPLKPISPQLQGRNYAMASALLVSAEDLVLFQSALANGRLLTQSSVAELWTPRGEVSIGQVTFGAFLSEHTLLGPKLRALGYEDWGDNAALVHYLDRDIIVAVTTSRGPAETTGAPPYRNQLSDAVEEILAETK